MEETKHYYENIDILRGIAILLVVLGHAVAKENIVTADSRWCNEIYNFIYSFHMPLFFIISGFCFTRYSCYWKFLIRKCRYLLIPYFSFCFLTMAAQRLLPFFTLVENDFLQEIKQIFLYGGSIWFVYALFEIMIIFPVIARIINGKMEKALLMLVVSMMIYVFWGKNISIFCIAQVTYYMPFFIIGHIFRIENERRNFLSRVIDVKLWIKFFTFIIILAICIAIYSLKNQLEGIPYISYLFRVLCALGGSTLSYILVMFLQNKKIKWFLKQLGQYSLQIYLFNGYFIAVSRTILFSICDISNTLILATINFIVGLVANYIWCYYILKIKFVRIVCGKR